MRARLTIALMLSAVAWQCASARTAIGQWHTWSLDDLVTVPDVRDVVLSDNGETVAYLLRIADQATDRPTFELHVMTIATRIDRLVAKSTYLEQVRNIPGQANWSVLGDFGEGVQLYSVSNAGAIRPLVVSPTGVLVGSAEGADPSYSGTPPTHMGVASYDWSPDGTRLFYSTLETLPAARRALVNDQVNIASARRRWSPQVLVRFFMRSKDGESVPVLTRPGTDRVARYLGALPVWGDDYLEYGVQGDDKPDPIVVRYRWRFQTRSAVPAPGDVAVATKAMVAGPHGRPLEIARANGVRHLIERLPDGTSFDFGPTMLGLSDGRSPGHWRSPSGGYALVAVRILDEARYALLRLDADGRSRLIQTHESLTHCAFNASVTRGVCVHEGLMLAPELVEISVEHGTVRSLSPISRRHSTLRPFATERRTWLNQFGYKAVGFVMYPRDYRKGQRYPSIIITHGSDADERFAAPDLQWSYPVQAFLERGYVVLAVNDPYTAQSETLEAAQRTWNSCDGRLASEDLRRLIWLNAVESYRSLIDQLAREGLVDPARVGIAGYSAGSQMTNVAITQTNLFKAASSGDGAYLEPAGYRYLQCSYRAVFGGAPGDPKAIPNYLALAPSYRADRTTAAVLQQLAEPRAGALDFYQALRAANVPAEVTLYPGETPASDETHLLHIPSNRRAAMEENIEWFDFWLKGIRPASTGDPERARRWEAMRRTKR